MYVGRPENKLGRYSPILLKNKYIWKFLMSNI
jgi:hypothetical protein